jgi:predicted nuclease of predicted toxin-antitoxin system
VKVVVDENLPPALARALHALFAGEHEVIHIRDRYGPGVTDLQWIPELSSQGSWVVISGDRRMGPGERMVENVR